MGDTAVLVPSRFGSGSTLGPHLKGGKVSQDRQAVHDQIISEEAADAVSQPPGSKRALITGGGTASGKSTLIDSDAIGNVPPDAIRIDQDRMKLKLPETKGKSSTGKDGGKLADQRSDWASAAHEESAYLAKRLFEAAQEKDANIILDRTSREEHSTLRDIKKMRDAGYDVEGMWVTTDPKVASQLAADRAKQDGREVPASVFRAAHDGANRVWLSVAQKTGIPSTLVTTVRDGDPIVTARADGNGNVAVEDVKSWEEYVTRVGGIPPGITITTPTSPAPPAPQAELRRVDRTEMERIVKEQISSVGLDIKPDRRELQTKAAHAQTVYLDPADKEAIEAYSGDGYEEINADLRSGEYNEDAETMTAAANFLKQTIPQELDVVFRGSSGPDDLGASLNVSDVFTDSAFTSVSQRRRVAYDFSNNVGSMMSSANNSTFYRIRVSPEMRERGYVLVGNTDEEEWILPAGSSFTVGDITELETHHGAIHRIIDITWTGAP